MKMRRLTVILFAVCFAFVLSNSTAMARDGKQDKKKVYRVEMRTTTFGGVFYVLGFGAMDLLNKYSDWVHGSVLESTGSAENIKLVGKDPRKKSRTIFVSTALEQTEAMEGNPPFEDTPDLYKGVKSVISIGRMGLAFITVDPGIKSISDFKGKRVSTWPKGTTKFRDAYTLIAGAGKEVLDSIKWQYTQYEGYEDLLVGKVDVALGWFPMVTPGKFVAGLKLRELMTRTDKLSVVGATKQERALTKKLYGPIAGSTGVLPAGSIAPGFPAEHKLIFTSSGCWGAYPELPNDVVYEMLRVWKEHYSGFKKYHPIGACLVPEDWGLLPITKEMFHPGAVKFFEDNGIPYGLEVSEQRENEMMEKMNIK